MRILLFILTTDTLFYISGCASRKPADFGKGNSKSDPEKFFIDKTHSDGVVENAGGKPTTRIKTETIWYAYRRFNKN